MRPKKKICDGPCGLVTFIWKNYEGKRYCKQCWSALSVVADKPTKKRNPLPSRSSKRIKEEREYSILRKDFLKKNPICKARIHGCCTVQATEVHHKKGRTGSLYLDVRYFLPACHGCHVWIENNPKEAKEMGLSESRLT